MLQDQSRATYSENGPCTTLMRTSRFRLKSVFSKKCYLFRINNKKYYSVECLLLEVSVTRTSQKAALSANRLSEYSSSLLEYNIVDFYEQKRARLSRVNCNNVRQKTEHVIQAVITSRPEWRHAYVSLQQHENGGHSNYATEPAGVNVNQSSPFLGRKCAISMHTGTTWQIRLHILHEAQMSLWNNANRILK